MNLYDNSFSTKNLPYFFNKYKKQLCCEAYETTCVKQRKLAYKGKTQAMLAPMLKTMLNPEFSFHLC